MIGLPSVRGRIRSGSASLLAAGILSCANCLPLFARQTPAALILGRVLEAGSRRPLADVAVRLDGGDRVVQTGDDGGFRFEGVAPGAHVIEVEHLSFLPVTDTLVLTGEGATYRVEISLSERPLALEPIVVTVIPVGSPLADVEDRMQRMRALGLGEIFDRDAIERSGASRVSHLVAQLPGARLQPVAGRAGVTQLRLHATNDCAPSFYMDGRKVETDGAALDDFVALMDVAFVEVYRRLSTLPAEFADEQAQYCGAVAVWTLRGTNDGGEMSFARTLAAVAVAAIVFLAASMWCC